MHHLPALPPCPPFSKTPPWRDLGGLGFLCWHFSHLPRKRKWCLRLLSTPEGHFLWGCPSDSCCLDFLTSCWLWGPGEIVASAGKHLIASRCMPWRSHRPESPQNPLCCGSVPMRHSAGVTEVARYKEHTLHHCPGKACSWHQGLPPDLTRV